MDWFPQRTVCYATMAQAWAEHRYNEMHKDAPFHDGTFTEWGSERTRRTPFHFRDDGVTLWMASVDLSPDDDFLAAAGPAVLAGDSDEPPDDHADASD